MKRVIGIANEDPLDQMTLKTVIDRITWLGMVQRTGAV